MKEQTQITSGTSKSALPPGMDVKPALAWGKSAKRDDTPVPPPVWTRYIDSRLKQFCAR